MQFLVARSLPSTPVVIAAADVAAAEELSEEGPPPTRLRNQRRYRSRSPAVTVFAGFAWVSGVYSLTVLVAILAAIVVVLGPLIIWWMPQGDRTNSASDPPPG